MVDDRYLLGIDVGTSVVKSVLFDLHGREIAIARSDAPIEHPDANWSEAEMNTIWSAVLDTVRQVTANKRGSHVAGIGVTGTCCGAWLIDEHGEPVRTAILWNDGRASDIVNEWQHSGLFSQIFAISGNALFPGYTLAVLAWLRRHEPETLDRARWLLFSKDWIRFKLTGDIATEETDCSYLPFDIRRRRLSSELFDLAGIGEYIRLVPRMVRSHDSVAPITAEIAAATGIPLGTPVVAGLVDVVASTLGAGVWQPGQACSIVGTSVLNSLVSNRPMFEPADVGVQAVMPGETWLRSLVNTSGTLNLEWMLKVLAVPEVQQAAAEGTNVYALIEAAVKTVPIGADGVVFHPYVNTAGVISPFVNPAARAQFFGIGVQHTRAHLMRAVYEGVALSMLDAYENMPEPTEAVLLSGGGARSAFWAQMFADATGRRVSVADGTELGARGAAMMAGIGAGVYGTLDEAVSVARVNRHYSPDPEAHRRYRAQYELYQKLYQQLGETWWLRHRILQEFKEVA